MLLASAPLTSLDRWIATDVFAIYLQQRYNVTVTILDRPKGNDGWTKLENDVNTQTSTLQDIEQYGD